MKKHCLKLRGPDVEHLVPPAGTTTSKFSNTIAKWCLRIADQIEISKQIKSRNERWRATEEDRIEREKPDRDRYIERESATNITNQNLQMDTVS